jgi:hypothetical protein
MQAIEREHAAEKLRMADAVAVHKSKEQSFKTWVREHIALAGE